jgi:hypothetical protein
MISVARQKPVELACSFGSDEDRRLPDPFLGSIVASDNGRSLPQLSAHADDRHALFHFLIGPTSFAVFEPAWRIWPKIEFHNGKLESIFIFFSYLVKKKKFISFLNSDPTMGPKSFRICSKNSGAQQHLIPSFTTAS